MKKIHIILATVLVFALNFTFTWATSSTIEIQGQHTIENNTSLKSFNNTYVLESVNNAPMPSGSVNNLKEVTVHANESFSFGNISFSNPGTYEYKVKRKVTDTKNLKFDNSVYLVKVGIYEDGTNSIIYKKDGEEGKSDKIKYVDTYIETYVLSFDPDGGVFSNGSKDILKIEGAYGEKVTIPEATTKEGYTFKYWKGSEYYPGQEYTITENHDFIAIYDEVKTADKESTDDTKTDTKTNTNSKSEKNKKGSKIKTGDTSEFLIYLSIFGIVALIALIYKKNKN